MAVEFLHELNVPFFKVGSGDTNNFRYLEKIALKGRPMVVSSGMQSMETMRCVYQTVKKHNQNFCILQCTSAYPLEAKGVNLRVITLGMSVVAKTAIPKDTILTLDIFQLVGKVTADVEEDESITEDIVDIDRGN